MIWILAFLGMMAIELSYLPQIARLHRLKRADDVSYFFPLLNVAGRILALAYSVARGEDVFVVGFLVGVVLRTALLAQVVWYRRLRRTSFAAAAVGGVR